MNINGEEKAEEILGASKKNQNDGDDFDGINSNYENNEDEEEPEASKKEYDGEGSGILFDLNNVGPVELATTSFGQGISVTAIQQIAAVSAAINGGNLYKPYVVKRIVNPDTKDIIKEYKPEIVRKVISNKTR